MWLLYTMQNQRFLKSIGQIENDMWAFKKVGRPSRIWQFLKFCWSILLLRVIFFFKVGKLVQIDLAIEHCPPFYKKGKLDHPGHTNKMSRYESSFCDIYLCFGQGAVRGCCRTWQQNTPIIAICLSADHQSRNSLWTLGLLSKQHAAHTPIRVVLY